MLSSKSLAGVGENNDENKKLVSKAGPAWARRIGAMPADERMKTWFDEASAGQRRMFLALAIQMSHAPAYPLFEADFIKRAAAADDFLYLDLSAYYRHRRAGGKKLFDQLEPVLRKQPQKDGPPGEQEFFFGMWKLLTDYDTLDAAIADWQAGKLELAKLHELLGRSIDQPWAYHSMGIEPASVFRPTMERSLKTLVTAAVAEQDLGRRFALLSMGSGAAGLMITVTHRSDEVERQPFPRSDSAEWAPLVRQLRELFKDERVMFDGRGLTSPADQAAAIIWDIWKPEHQVYDAERKNYRNDWRIANLHAYDNTTRSLLAPAAEYFLTQPDGVKVEEYPEQAGTALAARFVEGTAADWRKLLEPLPWNERLLLQAEVMRDRKFAHRLWPRLIQLVDWQGATPNEPASFAEVWREKLAGKPINDATWQALKEWIVAEARAGRYWSIIGESSPVRPGFSLYVLPTAFPARGEQAVPVFHIHLRSDGIGFYSRGESYRVGADKLDEFIGERDEHVQDWPKPLAAIKKQNVRQEDDKDRVSGGLSLMMVVLPPKQ